MKAHQPTYEIVYNGRNITSDILPYVLSFGYTDKTAGETDELELTVEDRNGLWINQWYPVKGDTITARIFSLGKVLECGTFTVDEISASGGSSGNTVSIKGVAAGINKRVRTKNCYAHENKTLREIANTIAAKHGMKVDGEIANVRISRVTQYRETDLKFLQRLANDYGYEFSVRDSLLTFSNIFTIEDKTAALTITPEEIISWSLTDKTSKTFQAVRISYHNPKEKKVVSYEHKEENEAFKQAKTDNMEIKVKAENKQQAEIKAKAALYKANSLQQQGSLEMAGNVYALAGNNCHLEGLGYFSGKYYIQSSSHTVSKDGGYTTSLELKRVGLKENKSTSTATTPIVEPAGSAQIGPEYGPGGFGGFGEATLLGAGLSGAGGALGGG